MKLPAFFFPFYDCKLFPTTFLSFQRNIPRFICFSLFPLFFCWYIGCWGMEPAVKIKVYECTIMMPTNTVAPLDIFLFLLETKFPMQLLTWLKERERGRVRENTDLFLGEMHVYTSSHLSQRSPNEIQQPIVPISIFLRSKCSPETIIITWHALHRG